MASSHISEGKFCRLHIRVRAEGCGHGCVVGIGGSCKALGYFDPRKALSLVTTPEAYPIWSTKTPLLVPADELLTYKFCLIEGGTFKAFEELPNPRSVIPNNIDTIIENIFNPSLVDRSMNDSEAKLLRIIDEETQNSDQNGAEDMGVHGSLYLVCYHLPVIVQRTGSVPSFSATWDNSLLARTDSGIADAMSTHWVGSVRVAGDPLSDTERSELVAILLRMRCVLIFIEEEVNNSFYYGYCKEVLWPVFHNVDQLDGASDLSRINNPADEDENTDTGESESYTWNYAKSYSNWWKSYQTVNERFCSSLKDRLHPQDVVWIHDYHLMLLPGLLRRYTNPALSIVFYLHIPFPTSQVDCTLLLFKFIYTSLCIHKFPCMVDISFPSLRH